MEILYLLIPISILFSLCALGAFVWSVRNGQFQDLDRPAEQLIFEERYENLKKEVP